MTDKKATIYDYVKFAKAVCKEQKIKEYEFLRKYGLALFYNTDEMNNALLRYINDYPDAEEDKKTETRITTITKEDRDILAKYGITTSTLFTELFYADTGIETFLTIGDMIPAHVCFKYLYKGLCEVEAEEKENE